MKTSTMKNIMKILTVLFIVATIVSLATPVFAEEITPDKITPRYDGQDVAGVQTKAQQIAGLIRNFAVIAAVIIIMVLGVKYMLGSVEEKADYKKSFVPLIIGIIVVVAATQIATFLFSVAGK